MFGFQVKTLALLALLPVTIGLSGAALSGLVRRALDATSAVAAG
jgi:hypothetical protein